MKVKKVWPSDKPSYGAIYYVYSLYEIDNKKYYVVSPDNYEGLLVMNEKEVEIIDSTLNESYNFYSDINSCGYKHKILMDDIFYGKLLECDPDSYNVFLGKLSGKKN